MRAELLWLALALAVSSTAAARGAPARPRRWLDDVALDQVVQQISGSPRPVFYPPPWESLFPAQSVPSTEPRSTPTPASTTSAPTSSPTTLTPTTPTSTSPPTTLTPTTPTSTTSTPPTEQWVGVVGRFATASTAVVTKKATKPKAVTKNPEVFRIVVEEVTSVSEVMTRANATKTTTTTPAPTTFATATSGTSSTTPESLHPERLREEAAPDIELEDLGLTSNDTDESVNEVKKQRSVATGTHGTRFRTAQAQSRAQVPSTRGQTGKAHGSLQAKATASPPRNHIKEIATTGRLSTPAPQRQQARQSHQRPRQQQRQQSHGQFLIEVYPETSPQEQEEPQSQDLQPATQPHHNQDQQQLYQQELRPREQFHIEIEHPPPNEKQQIIQSQPQQTLQLQQNLFQQQPFSSNKQQRQQPQKNQLQEPFTSRKLLPHQNQLQVQVTSQNEQQQPQRQQGPSSSPDGGFGLKIQPPRPAASWDDAAPPPESSVQTWDAAPAAPTADSWANPGPPPARPAGSASAWGDVAITQAPDTSSWGSPSPTVAPVQVATPSPNVPATSFSQNVFHGSPQNVILTSSHFPAQNPPPATSHSSSHNSIQSSSLVVSHNSNKSPTQVVSQSSIELQPLDPATNPAQNHPQGVGLAAVQSGSPAPLQVHRQPTFHFEVHHPGSVASVPAPARQPALLPAPAATPAPAQVSFTRDDRPWATISITEAPPLRHWQSVSLTEAPRASAWGQRPPPPPGSVGRPALPFHPSFRLFTPTRRPYFAPLAGSPFAWHQLTAPAPQLLLSPPSAFFFR